MRTMLTLLLTLAAAQQPQTPPRRVTRPAEPAQRALPSQPDPKTAYDTTTRVIDDVGMAVADVRAEVDRFRTRAFNDAISSVLEAGAAFRTACGHLTQVANQGQRLMCRACVHGGAQPAFDRYRAYLPTVASLGQRCTARLRANVTRAATSASLRQEALAMSTLIVNGLRPYEQRVAGVRNALMGPQRVPARRGG